MQVHSPLIHRRHRIRPLFWVLLALQIIALPVEAQNAGQNIIKGVIIGGAIIAASQANKKKAQAAKNGQNNNNPNAINGKAADTSAVAAFNAKPAATLVAANMDDATGTWDGEVA